MRLFLLTTCGTSVLTQRAPRETTSWLIEIANRPELGDDERTSLDAHATSRRQTMLDADAATRHDLSAEINSIDAVRKRFQPETIQHMLVHTDTAVGRAAYAVIAETLVADGEPVQSLTAAGLRADDPESFRNSLSDLTRQLDDWMSWRSDQCNVVFNLTGGFKALGSYLQAYGSLNADACVFLFERSPALIEIPRLPLKFAPLDEFRAHLDTFRLLAAGYDVSATQAGGIPESLLMSDGRTVTLSVWGEALWPAVRRTLYAEKLFDPLSDKLTYANFENAARQFDRFGEEDRIDTNAALDTLCVHLDAKRPLLKSQTPKLLQGNPAPPATHEYYCSNRHGAKRALGRLKDGRFTVDRLGDHL